jgi:starch-binding outer membrane protein, SusD/RagB family
MSFTMQGLDMLTRATMRSSRRLAVLALGGALVLASCNPLLRADDPDIITVANSANGAVALKNGIVDRFNAVTAGIQGADGIFEFGGLLADEWASGDTFEQRNTTDSRLTNVTNSFLATPIRIMQELRTEGRKAIDALRAYSPAPASNIALMFNLAAFGQIQLGETFCNGIVFSTPTATGIDYGSPVLDDSAFALAIINTDSAVATNGGTDATRQANFAAVNRGRALIDRGQFAAAATAVAAVPTTFTYSSTYSLNSRDNQNWALNVSSRRYILPNSEGGNGMNWRTAADPRLTVDPTQHVAFDGSSAHFNQTKWALRTDSVVVSSGIEARLIEAEAALQANDFVTFINKLNVARATKAGLANLVDPGTQAARVDMLFRERAFWLFGTGHRLGDLRRLIRQYGRSAETVFPTGPWFKGGSYGPDVNLPYSIDELNNPNIPQNSTTTSQSTCIDRNA